MQSVNIRIRYEHAHISFLTFHFGSKFYSTHQISRSHHLFRQKNSFFAKKFSLKQILQKN